MKKFLGLSLALCMSFMLVACSTEAAPEDGADGAGEATGATGVYTGRAAGYGGELTVEVTLENDKITAVTVTDHVETDGIGTNAIDALPSAMVEANSFDVDSVAGATVTSKAIVTAAKDATKEVFGSDEVSTAVADGTYSSTVSGYIADMTVDVTIENEIITGVNVSMQEETVGLGTKAIDVIPGRIVEHNSVAVDALSGASVTSNAIKLAVSNVLEEQGADMSKYTVVPEVVKGEDTVVDAQIVIVGAGGAGLSAAIEAVNQGATNVVVIEKMDITGGNTRMSGGEFAAPGNWVQIEEGITNDSVELFYDDVFVGGYEEANPDLVRIIADNALAAAEWARDVVGVEFRGSQSWYGGHTVARTLWPVGDGRQYMDTFESKARELGVDIHLSTTADSLITDDAGKVVGVSATHNDGSKHTYNASHGVILASGGFGSNVEMRDSYNSIWPSLDSSIPTTNSPAITGDGIVMAEAVGANLVGMDKIQLYPVNSPATGNYYYVDYARLNSTSLLVNQEGERFVDEKGTRDVISDATIKQTNSLVYGLVDAAVTEEQQLHELYGTEIDQSIKKGVMAVGTLEEVCAEFGVPADVVAATIERYNSLVDAGEDTDFGRTANFNKFGEGPYIMYESVVSVHHTMGGVEIDETARVINTEGEVIEGLYAAGEVTGGIHGGNRLGSVAIADTVIFGRVAATSVMENAAE